MNPTQANVYPIDYNIRNIRILQTASSGVNGNVNVIIHLFTMVSLPMFNKIRSGTNYICTSIRSKVCPNQKIYDQVKEL